MEENKNSLFNLLTILITKVKSALLLSPLQTTPLKPGQLPQIQSINDGEAEWHTVDFSTFVDSTLSNKNMAADAQKVGEELAKLLNNSYTKDEIDQRFQEGYDEINALIGGKDEL